jgi:hypothetical protein
MSYPGPVSLGAGTSTSFLLQAETGLIIESFSRKTESKSIEIYDGSVGYTTGEIFHDFMATYSVKGKTNVSGSRSGIAVAAPGVAVTIANLNTGNGVTSGGIYTKSTSVDHSNEQVEEFSLDAVQRPGIA